MGVIDKNVIAIYGVALALFILLGILVLFFIMAIGYYEATSTTTTG